MYTDFLKYVIENLTMIWGVAIGYSVFEWAFRILLMLAVGFDCKSRKNPKQAMWMVLTLFFPVIVGIVYAFYRNKPLVDKCASCGAPINTAMAYCAGCGSPVAVYDDYDERVKNTKNSHITFGFSVACFAIAMILYIVMAVGIIHTVSEGIFDYFDDFDIPYSDFSDDYHYDYSYRYGYEVDGKTVFYDRNGNAYEDEDDVVYYDKQGNKYLCNYYESVFVQENGTEFDSFYFYVDKDGYLYFDEAGYKDSRKTTIYYSDEKDSYFDDDGNVYFYAENVSWDENGNMIDEWGDPLISD